MLFTTVQSSVICFVFSEALNGFTELETKQLITNDIMSTTVRRMTKSAVACSFAATLIVAEMNVYDKWSLNSTVSKSARQRVGRSEDHNITQFTSKIKIKKFKILLSVSPVVGIIRGVFQK